MRRYRVWRCSNGHEVLEEEGRAEVFWSPQNPWLYLGNVWYTKRGILCAASVNGYDRMAKMIYCGRKMQPTEEYTEK